MVTLSQKIFQPRLKYLAAKWSRTSYQKIYKLQIKYLWPVYSIVYFLKFRKGNQISTLKIWCQDQRTKINPSMPINSHWWSYIGLAIRGTLQLYFNYQLYSSCLNREKDPFNHMSNVSSERGEIDPSFSYQKEPLLFVRCKKQILLNSRV